MYYFIDIDFVNVDLRLDFSVSKRAMYVGPISSPFGMD